MGEARQRGTFEERKAQAIAAGRVKNPPKRWSLSTTVSNAELWLRGMVSLFGRGYTGSPTKRNRGKGLTRSFKKKKEDRK